MNMRVLVGRFPARVVGLLLLLAWLALWTCSLWRGVSCARGWSWLPLWDKLAIDLPGNYLCSRAWLAGENPYQLEFASPIPATYGYTPQTLWQFAWCALVPSLGAAELVWFGISTAIFCLGVWQCLKVRRELDLGRLDPALALGLVLFSSPVFLELERSNCNVLVLLHLLIAVTALRWRSLPGDLLAGAAIAFASWTKVYPFMAIPALLVLGRRRAMISAAVFAVVIALADLPGMAEFWAHRKDVASIHHPGVRGVYMAYAHPIGAWWTLMWKRAGVDFFGKLPEAVIAVVLMLPFLALASSPILNLPAHRRANLVLPYLFVAISIGTFILPISYDYNLLFLPLALLCVTNLRSRRALALLVIGLPWLQPLIIPINPFIMTVFKLCVLSSAIIGLRQRCAAINAGAPS
ncbi:MAG: DUF2029 domain-containing protein [Phycisphaeraceae bacterium]|nr:DUF2029 domain-containing protein [Phycisphaeraceae bacterium]